MKRNNKGFTLVELLAAVAILSILAIFSIPIIIGLFDNTKNKVYVDDAKKLITQAEYKLRANSSTMEKPDEGDCILISMLYLDNADFDNPPEDGKYEKESSYVVVKNVGGDLEYSVTIVEKLKKGGYKGIELIKQSDLLTSSAVNHVEAIKEGDVLNVETDVNRGYLNEKLGDNYISNDNSISAVYNYPDLTDSSSNIGIYGAPRIVLASLVSSSSKGFNSLDATLQLKVEDKDTPRSDLNVYIAVDSGYENATTPISYGDDDTFSYSINFANYGKTYDGSSVKVYVIVKDPEGNDVKKTLTYKIHNNVPPEIDDASEIKKRPQDKFNMLTALVKLVVTDDIDEASNLSVCFRESSTEEDFDSCDSYSNFYDVFSNENTAEYYFHECPGGKCRRDGSTHYLTVFVKDSLGGIAKKRLSYTFSVNKIPKIKTHSLQSRKETFTTTGSKVIVVNVTATDDVDSNDQMRVRISDGIGYATYNYSAQPIYYTINGNYDGSTKNIQITVIDSEDGYSEPASEKYTVYRNQKPIINSYSIESSAAACLNQALCPPSEGGSKVINVYLDAEDDIDYDRLMVCLSIDENSCNDYKSYKYYDNKTQTYTIPHEYDGSTQTIHIFVKDSYSRMAKESLTYKLYTNNPPVLDYAVFNSRTDGKPVSGSLHAIFNINAMDDVDDANNLRFQIIEDGVVTLNNARLSDYIGKDNNIKLAGAHDGQQRHIEVKLIDTDGATDSKSMTYDVYEGRSPTIDLFNVSSAEIPCINDLYCPLEEGGNYTVKYTVKASDDIDDDSDIQICVSESNTTCDNYSSYSNYIEDTYPKEMSYTFSVNHSDFPYDGGSKTLYLYVKDSDNNVVKRSFDYKLYKNKKPVITEDPTIVTTADDLSFNLTEAVYTIEAEDDIDESLQIKYCNKKDNNVEYCTGYKKYKKKETLNNNFFRNTVPNGDVYTVYSVIKDSYGAETKSKEITYKLYVDSIPSIYSANIGTGRRIYKNGNGEEVDSLDGVINPSEYSEYTRLKINFSVDDPYDWYSVCVSSNNSVCDNYQGMYEANKCSNANCSVSRKSYSIYYDRPGFIEDNDHIDLYLFVKDLYDKVETRELYSGEYTTCEYEGENASYVYEFTSGENNTEPISIDRCAGQCYYYNNGTINNISSRYTRKITYFDKFNSNIACNAENPDESVYEAYCDFKDCFYKGDNYNRNAIGLRLIPDESSWTTKVNGNDYVCTGHYNLYLSSYNTGDMDITLDKTSTKICNTALDNGEYDFDTNSSNPYVRIAD